MSMSMTMASPLHTADPRHYTLTRLRKRVTTDPSLGGRELEREGRSFQRQALAALGAKHRLDFERQDAWLQAQAAGEAEQQRPFAWEAVVSPVQFVPLYDYDSRLRAGLSQQREYELVLYGCAFVLPEDVGLVQSLAAARHQNVHAQQLPLRVIAKLLDDPLLEARRLAYEEYVAFVDRLTGSGDDPQQEPPLTDPDRTLEQILGLWNQQHDDLVAQHAPLIKNKAGRGRLRS